MTERRMDPRTDPQFSLRNLLRIRALRQRLDLAVVSTEDGIVMAGNQEGRAAQRIAAEAALLVRGQERIERSSRRSGATMKAVRFSSRGRSLCLSVLKTQASAERDTQNLNEIAAAVLRILSEAEESA
ncbi:MAG: hypothetical protein JKY65_27650 [Planctomycetes bacterium]|nr:hypothetical protein [Planctomycetota bacterium]